MFVSSQLLSPAEAAARLEGRGLAVSPTSIRRWIRSGDLPALRVGARLRIEPDDLERVVQRAGPDAQEPQS